MVGAMCKVCARHSSVAVIKHHDQGNLKMKASDEWSVLGQDGVT